MKPLDKEREPNSTRVDCTFQFSNLNELEGSSGEILKKDQLIQNDWTESGNQKEILKDVCTITDKSSKPQMKDSSTQTESMNQIECGFQWNLPVQLSMGLRPKLPQKKVPRERFGKKEDRGKTDFENLQTIFFTI